MSIPISFVVENTVVFLFPWAVSYGCETKTVVGFRRLPGIPYYVSSVDIMLVVFFVHSYKGHSLFCTMKRYRLMKQV